MDLGSRISPTVSGPSEKSYCSTSTDYTSVLNTTVSGTATYQARQILGIPSDMVHGLGNAGAAQPIRRAEVRVTNENGSVVQCAETDNNGQFSFLLPRGNANYKVSINSRAFNTHLKASVLNAPESNTFYSLSTEINAQNHPVNIGTINAGVTGNVLGAAFNILDQLLKANEYISANVGTCALPGCTAVTVLPKVTAYWEKGFNPGSYFGEGALSFYLPGYSRLFILGGENGDVDVSDTDHFDNSVILHEYGHFIEDIMSISDSPGGSHNGNKVIDPRLAWSEGWGNFLQAAVLNDPRYIDTIGNISAGSGATDFLFYLSIETASAGNDMPTIAGEGNFREFSITRMLWDVIDNTPGESLYGGTDSVNGRFDEIWAALTSTDGFMNTSTAFRDVGLLHQVQATRLGGGVSDWTDLRDIERHVKEDQDSSLAASTERYRREYALYVDNTPACSYSFTITPDYSSSSYNGAYNRSHLLKNNDFVFYKHPGGAFNLTLTYSSTGTEVDLDLFVYKESARFANANDVVASSYTEPDGNNATVETESVSANLPAGNYLINVNAWTTNGGTGSSTSYELSIAGGAKLCPAIQP